MRVASRVALGSGVAVILLLAVLAWDLSLVDRLAGEHQELSQIDFRASNIALQQAKLMNQVDEFTRKLYITGDSAYADRLAELRTLFAQHLAELSALDVSPEVRAEIQQLAQTWESYRRQLSRFPSVPSESDLLAEVNRLGSQVDRVSQAAQEAVTLQAANSAEVSGQARRISWGVAAAALLVSVIILGLTIRSINRPLSLLTRGTEAVAEGEFDIELETVGSDELSKLAASFNQMVRRLGEAESAKKEFLSHVSHELKTPLASMHETNELLLEEIPGPLNEKQKRFLVLNLDSSRRLSAMISKLLDLSRLEAGAMDYDFRSHELADVIKIAVAGFEARARDQGVRLAFRDSSGGVVVSCDRDRLIQIVENLIDNALKYSPRSDVVQVSLRYSVIGQDNGTVWVGTPRPGRRSATDAMALIEVADSGPGIPDDQKGQIFDRFHQLKVNGPTAAPRGVGLGLAICREIAAAHNGTIGVRNNEGGGSVFMVALPAELADSEPYETIDEAGAGAEIRSVAT